MIRVLPGTATNFTGTDTISVLPGGLRPAVEHNTQDAAALLQCQKAAVASAAAASTLPPILPPIQLQMLPSLPPTQLQCEWDQAGRSYELHESMEQPARFRAHSGRFSA